jgi:hypothetical protein
MTIADFAGPIWSMSDLAILRSPTATSQGADAPRQLPALYELRLHHALAERPDAG